MIFLVNIANIFKGKFYMQIIFCKKYKNDSKSLVAEVLSQWLMNYNNNGYLFLSFPGYLSTRIVNRKSMFDVVYKHNNGFFFSNVNIKELRAFQQECCNYNNNKNKYHFFGLNTKIKDHCKMLIYIKDNNLNELVERFKEGKFDLSDLDIQLALIGSTNQSSPSFLHKNNNKNIRAKYGEADVFLIKDDNFIPNDEIKKDLIIGTNFSAFTTNKNDENNLAIFEIIKPLLDNYFVDGIYQLDDKKGAD